MHANHYKHWREQKLRQYEEEYSSWMKDKRGIAPSRPDLSTQAFYKAEHAYRMTIH